MNCVPLHPGKLQCQSCFYSATSAYLLYIIAHYTVTSRLLRAGQVSYLMLNTGVRYRQVHFADILLRLHGHTCSYLLMYQCIVVY